MTDSTSSSHTSEGDKQENIGRTAISRGGRPVGDMLHGLKEARVQADLGGKELAALAGVHEQTIRKLENLHAGADPRTTLKLARALGVKRSVLRNAPEDEGA